MPDYFSSEAKAINFLKGEFVDDGPTEIAHYVELLKDDMEDDGQDRNDWWKDISGYDLREWLFNNV